jgi:hypothetical protein
MDKPIMKPSREEEGSPCGRVRVPEGKLSRQDREAAALRENLRKRKEQARAREKAGGVPP